MIEPYYEQDGITIYNADCRDVLPQLEPVDLVLTDPPYGIDLAYKGCNTRNKERAIEGDATPFDPSVLLGFERLIIWGGNNFADALPRGGGWLCWDKRIRNDKSNLANQCDGEIAWTNLTTRILFFRHLWIGAFRGSENGRPTMHPTQKPEILMRWCISLVPNAQSILDPFMGSGTTLRAAKDLGLKAIGIEIEKKYCDIAVERLRQRSLLPAMA